MLHRSHREAWLCFEGFAKWLQLCNSSPQAPIQYNRKVTPANVKQVILIVSDTKEALCLNILQLQKVNICSTCVPAVTAAIDHPGLRLQPFKSPHHNRGEKSFITARKVCFGMPWAQFVCSHWSSAAPLNDFCVFPPLVLVGGSAVVRRGFSERFVIAICWNNIDSRRRILSSRHLVGDSWSAKRVLEGVTSGDKTLYSSYSCSPLISRPLVPFSSQVQFNSAALP